MNDQVAQLLNQLIMLGADFQLTYEGNAFRPWRLDVRDGASPARFESIHMVSMDKDLPWATTFCANTVIQETGADLPLHAMPKW